MSRALQRNAADPAQVRYAERKEKRDRDELLAALRIVLATGEGRLVLHQLLSTSRVDLASFSTNGSEMCFNEGQRNVGLRWKALCYEAAPELYELMEREARVQERRRETETAAVLMPSAQAEESHGED